MQLMQFFCIAFYNNNIIFDTQLILTLGTLSTLLEPADVEVDVLLASEPTVRRGAGGAGRICRNAGGAFRVWLSVLPVADAMAEALDVLLLAAELAALPPPEPISRSM